MSTDKTAVLDPSRAAKNRRNSLASTGPRTSEGKAVASKNSTRHGILSKVEVLPGIESRDDWDNHLAGVVADADPRGYLEMALVERIALALWRLRRVARYELEATIAATEADLNTDEIATAEADVAKVEANLHFLATLLDLPEDQEVPADFAASLLDAMAQHAHLKSEVPRQEVPVAPEQIEISAAGSTAGYVVNWAEKLAGESREDLGTLIGLLRAILQARNSEWRENTAAQIESWRTSDDRVMSRMSIPDDASLEKVTRYEVHLERSLVRNLRELQRLQAMRLGVVQPWPQG